MSCSFAPAQCNQTLREESAIESDERHHVGNRAEGNVVEKSEKIGFRPLAVPKSASAQDAIDGDDGHESEPDRREMTEPREIVTPIWIHNGDRRRQGFVGLMVIDHNHIETARFGMRKRL